VGEEVVPVYAQGFYVVSPGVVNMVIIFDYMDRGQHYAKLLRRGGEELEREVSTVWENMQRFMDEEIVRINGQRVRPLIHDVYIALRGSPTRLAKGTRVGGREYIRFRWRPGGGAAERRG
jgi:hypothetical protein